MKLSIIVAVYNQERYVERTIKSILCQNISCEYEVLIGEDCSTDNTRSVLKGLESVCPSNYHFFYRKNNLGPSGNFNDLYKRMKGQYFLVIEGDDYFLYNLKLQEQIEFLDKNPEHIACAHNVLVVDENSKERELEYPDCKKEEYSIFDYANFVLPGQTASILARNYFKDASIDKSILDVPYYAGDRRRAFFLICNGKIHCIQKKWSAYRYVTDSGSSFSATIRDSIKTREQDILFLKKSMEYARKNCGRVYQKNCEAMWILALYGGYRKKVNQISIATILLAYISCKYKLYIIKYLCSYFLNKKTRNVVH